MVYDIIRAMNLKEIFKKINFDQLKQSLDKLNLSKKIDQVIIVDFGTKLTLINLELKAETKIKALKIIDLPLEQEDRIILGAISEFISENNIGHNQVIFRTDLDSLIIKRIQLPAVPEAELTEAIKWQIKEDIPFELAKSVLDYSIIQKKTEDDGSKTLDIVCVVAKEEEIKTKVLLLKQAGLKCLAVGVLPFAYGELLKHYLNLENNKHQAVLHLDENLSYLTIYHDTRLEFYRELPISVFKLKKALSGTLVSDRGKVELSLDEATDVLFNSGIPDDNSIHKDKISSSQILSLLRPILERLAQEIKRSLSYYANQFETEGIDQINISGSGSNIPNIASFLTKETNLTIKESGVLAKIKVQESLDNKTLAKSYWNLALGLNYQKNINLLPYEFRTEKSEKVQKISLRWVGFIAFLLLGVSYLFSQAQISAQRKRLDSVLMHLNVISEIQEMKASIDELAGFFKQTKLSGLLADRLLKRLSSFAPRELFIDKLALDNLLSSGNFSGFVKSGGRAPEEILTKFIAQMEGSQYFTDLSLSSLKKRKEASIDIAEYNITFKIP